MPDVRFEYILERLVTHIHEFSRETRLSTEEWMAAINVLTPVGQISSDVRQELILVSSILGRSLLVDSIDHPKLEQATEGPVLWPFHTHEAPVVQAGHRISHDLDTEPCLAIRGPTTAVTLRLAYPIIPVHARYIKVFTS